MIFQVDGQDFADCLKLDGLGWGRNDIDGPKAGRTLDAVMHRDRVGTKRKLSVSLGVVDGLRLRALVAALDKQYVDVTYDDPQTGRDTRTFYGSEVTATPFFEQGGTTWYRDGAFSLVER